MKRKLCCLAFGILNVVFFATFSQNTNKDDCTLKLEEAVFLLSEKEKLSENSPQIIKLLTSCADQGNVNAQYALGYYYIKGKLVVANEQLAFKYIEKASLQDHPKALYELAMMYMDGKGCVLNFDTALSLFEKAYELGNQEAGYKIGYMYFKGLGSIDQNYSEAIEWFERSNYAMSKHFLGICNYFGFGMPVDKDKALGFFLDNVSPNSKFLLAHLENQPEILSLGVQKENTVKATEFSESKIKAVVVQEPTTVNENNEVVYSNKQLLEGDWKGKLIELDWAQEKMLRSFPVNLSLKANNATNDLDYTIDVDGKKATNYGIYLDENYHFNDFNIALPRLYQDNNTFFEINYNILSIHNIEIKNINNINYLTAFVEGYNVDWKEPMQPMLLILGNAKALTSNGVEIDDDLIQALASLEKDNFIMTYPNPFESDLLVQYDLEEESTTAVSIYNLTGDFIKTIVSGEVQKAGKHLYHINGASYPNGLYVVKVTANSAVYTKLIIKK